MRVPLRLELNVNFVNLLGICELRILELTKRMAEYNATVLSQSKKVTHNLVMRFNEIFRLGIGTIDHHI